MQIKDLKHLTSNTNVINFAIACYQKYTIDELESVLTDTATCEADCAAWKIKPEQWMLAIGTALDELRTDRVAGAGLNHDEMAYLDKLFGRGNQEEKSE